MIEDDIKIKKWMGMSRCEKLKFKNGDDNKLREYLYNIFYYKILENNKKI